MASFVHTLQLAHRDVIFGETGAILLLKWSKTMQNRKDFATLFICQQGLHCAVTMALSLLVRGSQRSPLNILA